MGNCEENNMYKKEIIKLLEELDCELEINENEYEKDLRRLGLDSIAFIRFLAMFEEKFEFEFDYGFLDAFETVSITILNKILEGNK